MKFLIGIIIGVFYVVLVVLAFGHSSQAWQAGQADLGFWWSVIGTLLGIAGTGAVVGSWLHTRPAKD